MTLLQNFQQDLKNYVLKTIFINTQVIMIMYLMISFHFRFHNGAKNITEYFR
jgi:hypothetical protein